MTHSVDCTVDIDAAGLPCAARAAMRLERPVAEVWKTVEDGWVSGEPRGIRLRFDLEPLDDGKACMLRSSAAFDAMSLGWLAKYFLKHHPEIQFGVMPGVAVGLLESMRQALAA